VHPTPPPDAGRTSRRASPSPLRALASRFTLRWWIATSVSLLLFTIVLAPSTYFAIPWLVRQRTVSGLVDEDPVIRSRAISLFVQRQQEDAALRDAVRERLREAEGARFMRLVEAAQRAGVWSRDWAGHEPWGRWIVQLLRHDDPAVRIAAVHRLDRAIVQTASRGPVPGIYRHAADLAMRDVDGRVRLNALLAAAPLLPAPSPGSSPGSFDVDPAPTGLDRRAPGDAQGRRGARPPQDPSIAQRVADMTDDPELAIRYTAWLLVGLMRPTSPVRLAAPGTAPVDPDLALAAAMARSWHAGHSLDRAVAAAYRESLEPPSPSLDDLVASLVDIPAPPAYFEATDLATLTDVARREVGDTIEPDAAPAPSTPEMLAAEAWLEALGSADAVTRDVAVDALVETALQAPGDPPGEWLQLMRRSHREPLRMSGAMAIGLLLPKRPSAPGLVEAGELLDRIEARYAGMPYAEKRPVADVLRLARWLAGRTEISDAELARMLRIPTPGTVEPPPPASTVVMAMLARHRIEGITELLNPRGDVSRFHLPAMLLAGGWGRILYRHTRAPRLRFAADLSAPTAEARDAVHAAVVGVQLERLRMWAAIYRGRGRTPFLPVSPATPSPTPPAPTDAAPPPPASDRALQP